MGSNRFLCIISTKKRKLLLNFQPQSTHLIKKMLQQSIQGNSQIWNEIQLLSIITLSNILR